MLGSFIEGMILLSFNYCINFLGLYRLQEFGSCLPPSHRWSLPEEAFPKGLLPHCGALGELYDDEG